MFDEKDWLAGYDVVAPSGTATTAYASPVSATSQPATAAAASVAGRSSEVENTLDGATRRRMPAWLPQVATTVALWAGATYVLDVAPKPPRLESGESLIRVAPPSVVDPQVSAILLQVRDRQRAPEYVEKSPTLSATVRRWNSSAGRFAHDVSIDDLPIFIPEPRPGLEREFEALVEEGLGKYDLHIFRFRSEDHLYKVVNKCDVPDVDWVKKWSSWRGPGERVQTTRCRSGGICIVIAEHCDEDAFS